MAIPESQLDIWSKVGAVKTSKDTADDIKAILKSASALYANRTGVDVFLQGSYGNDTNIRDVDSDVDIVMCMESTCTSDIDRLTPQERAAYSSNWEPASYPYADFKKDVVSWLRTAYGKGNVTEGNKAVHIAGDSTRRPADVLVCMEHLVYTSYPNPYQAIHIPGVAFDDRSGARIINFPKAHLQNATAKHQATNGYYKPTVRILKNMRNRMIDRGLIRDGLAPSYFLEGLAYNVPDSYFGQSFTSTLSGVIGHVNNQSRAQFTCVNGLHPLHGYSKVTWPSPDCDEFIRVVIDYWNDWK